MKLARLFILLFVALPVACGGHAGVQSPRPNLNVLSAEDLQASRHDNLYDAIRALRSNWVRERPPSDHLGAQPEVAQVFVDGMHRGDVEVLRQLHVGDVESVRYLSVTEAISTFGRLAQAGPAIVITSRRGP